MKFLFINFLFINIVQLIVTNVHYCRSNESTIKLKIALLKSGVVPDVINTSPPYIAMVRYENALFVNLGNQLTPASTSRQPKVEWSTEANSLYTLAVVDPDAPSRQNPQFAEWLHWLVVNIKGTDISSGKSLASYEGPTPPPGTGLHRYVILIYKQPASIQANVENRRMNFNIRRFAGNHGLGDPIAANFFQAQD